MTTKKIFVRISLVELDQRFVKVLVYRWLQMKYFHHNNIIFVIDNFEGALGVSLSAKRIFHSLTENWLVQPVSHKLILKFFVMVNFFTVASVLSAKHLHPWLCFFISSNEVGEKIFVLRSCFLICAEHSMFFCSPG